MTDKFRSQGGPATPILKAPPEGEGQRKAATLDQRNDRSERWRSADKGQGDACLIDQHGLKGVSGAGA